jgi:hypothetical protein
MEGPGCGSPTLQRRKIAPGSARGTTNVDLGEVMEGAQLRLLEAWFVREHHALLPFDGACQWRHGVASIVRSPGGAQPGMRMVEQVVDRVPTHPMREVEQGYDSTSLVVNRAQASSPKTTT